METKIVLSGKAGSGKTSIGKELARNFGVQFKSVGDYTREYAEKKHQLDINEFQKYCMDNPEEDRRIDEYIITECSKMQGFILDYRLGFHFIPKAYSIFLKIDDTISAERIAFANRQKEFKTNNMEEVLKTIKERNNIMQRRFLETYGVDFLDERNYKLVIDCNKLTIPEIVDIIKENINKDCIE